MFRFQSLRTLFNITNRNKFSYELPKKYNLVQPSIKKEKEKCLMCHSNNKCPFNTHYPCYPNQ